MNHSIQYDQFSANPFASVTTTSSDASGCTSDSDDTSPSLHHLTPRIIPKTPFLSSFSYRSLSVITGHTESVSCIALCGEFIITASHAKEIMVWQQPDLRLFTKFGQGRGSVKALVTFGTKIFTAHQDSKIRVWRVSRNVENIFKLVDTLPTRKDYLAHDDAINALTSSKGTIFSASADGTIKAWGRINKLGQEGEHYFKGILEGHKDISINAVMVSDDGSVVYGGGSDGYVMVWLVDGWKMVYEVEAHKMSILCMCMKGDILCTGSTDRSIGVWKREGKGLIKMCVMKGHDGPIKCLQVAPNSIGGGFLVYSGSIDRSIRVWWVPNRSKGDDFETKITKTTTQRILF
ncbi:JINGUBANG-like protein [Tanacetum coccineum]